MTDHLQLRSLVTFPSREPGLTRSRAGSVAYAGHRQEG